MKILMLAEYFTPYDIGGSEWSTYYLAKGLIEKGFSVTILTPNYGHGKIAEKKDGINIIRFPYKKNIGKLGISPFWHTNILWLIWTTFFTTLYSLKIKPDVIHIQGKYFLPAALFNKLFFSKKIVITLRDYIILCPLGMCLLRGNKVCSTRDYILKDIKQHLNLYHQNRGLVDLILLTLAALRMRAICFILKLLLRLTDRKIVISHIVKKLYEKQGFKDIQVIVNPISFSKQKRLIKRQNQVVFAGRLTPGKGADTFLESIPRILKELPNFKFIFLGEGGLKNNLIKQTKTLKISKKVKFLGYIPHDRLLKILSKSKLSVTPSLWPEPFGRLPIESLMYSTPVIVSGRAGVANYIKDKKWGKISNPTPYELSIAAIYVLKNFYKISRNLTKDKEVIKHTFYQKVIDAHKKLYYEVKT